jgi:hypothetical protein
LPASSGMACRRREGAMPTTTSGKQLSHEGRVA